MSAEHYETVGVNYSILDKSKRSAISAAQATSSFLAGHGGQVVEESRGASAFVFNIGGMTLAFVIEGLGTKSVIARMWLEATGEDRFRDIGIDAVGAIVNDICSVGALPFVINAYFATGNSEWHLGGNSFESLLVGWRDGCEISGATWGGGESPALPGLVSGTDVEVAGSGIGALPGSWGPILGEELRDGDAIVLIESSGLHANGASLARSAADQLPRGLRTPLPSGDAFGASVLRPSTIYAPLVRELSKREIRPTYLSHITGHGFRKLMRAPADLVYIIDRLPPVPEVFTFITQTLEMNDRAAYGTFNMGAGFAVYVRPEDASGVIDTATSIGLRAWQSGRVEAGRRRVELPTLGITFEGPELELS